MQLQLERKGKLEAQEKMLNTQKKLHDSSEMPNGDYTKVIVEWFDAYEMESGWQTIEYAIKIKPPIIYSLGYVLNQQKDFITIAGDIGRKGDSDCGRVQLIPKSWIKKIKLIDKS